jgi:hypothetical protein
MIYSLVAWPRAALNRSDAFLSTVSASIDPRPCRAADYVIVAEAARLRIISILGWRGRID